MELLPTEDLSRARGARGEALALPAGPRRETVPGPGGAGEAAEAIGAGGAAEVGTAAGGAEAAGAGGASVAFGTADAADAPGAALAARRAQLARLGAAIAERREELIAALVVHARKIRRLATREVDFALARLRAFDEVEARLAGRAPVGGVAIVLPGNVGISNPVATIGTAYLAGNRVVARFPGALRAWAELLEPLFTRHLPGVVFDHRGGAEFLRAVLADPAIAVVLAFGDDRWAAACEPEVRAGRKKLIFEGPGKDPFLVLPGADLERAARDAVRGAYYDAGQACTSPERFYVHADLLAEFTERVVELTRAEVVGDPADGASTVGPIARRKVVERIAGQLADARARGARVVAGGGFADCVLPDGTPATYVEPTVLTGCDAAMALMQEETFGPIIPIQTVAGEEQAAELAGASRYGLAASLYGGGEDAGRRLAECHGQVFRDEIWLDFFGRHLHAPYGGRKRSGWVWEWEGDRFVHREGTRVNAIELSRAAL
jgi:betaine-aldehyde dehydrogenase